MSLIMTTKEVAQYLKLHEITICKYAAQGIIPAIRIGRVWRFDKEALDKWIQEGTKEQPAEEQPTPARGEEQQPIQRQTAGAAKKKPRKQTRLRKKKTS